MRARSPFDGAALREQAHVDALAPKHGAGAMTTTPKSATGKLSRAADAHGDDVSPLSGLGRIGDGLGQTEAQSPIGDRLTPSGANKRAEVASPTLAASLSVNLSETTHEQTPTRNAHPRRSFDAHAHHCEIALVVPGAAS